MTHSTEAGLPTVTLWGSPLDAEYQQLYRELEVLTTLRRFVTRHRHHALDSPERRWVAEAIEVATFLERRHVAIRWFVSHGKTGMLGVRTLASEWELEPDRFERDLATAIGSRASENDIREARALGVEGRVIASVSSSYFFAQPNLDQIKRALDALGAQRTSRPSIQPPQAGDSRGLTEPPRCADCGATHPSPSTRELLSAEHGWRARRLSYGSGEIRYEWRCSECWRRFLAQKPPS
jgi:hypothetical protein